jgi:ABC-type sugar transport system permease subunit
MVFAYMFNTGQRGLVNYLLVDVFHLTGEYVNWLQKTWTANAVIWIMGIWKNIINYPSFLQQIDSWRLMTAETGSNRKMFFSCRKIKLFTLYCQSLTV